RIAEHVEWRAAQFAQSRKKLECGHDPWPECDLSRLATVSVTTRETGRREMERQSEVTFELFAQPRGELSVAVEPGHFVFVLVGHQLVQRLDHRARQRLVPWNALLLGGPDATDQLFELRGVARILVALQKLASPGNQLIERFGFRRAFRASQIENG